MNRKQKLVISITGITIVMLALLGLTYGYYLTRIQGNTNSNSISITTADLTLKYDDGSSYINLTNIMPGMITDGEGDNPEPKVFTVTNDGSGDVEYSIGIDEVTNTLTRTEDLTYSITCVEKLIDSADTAYKACATTPSNSGEYPKTNSYLFTNQIKQDYRQKYTVIISYANPDEDQSIDMGSTIKGRMQIYSLPESIDITGTVTGASKGDYVQINSNPKISQIVDGKYKLIGIEPGTHTLKVMNGSTTKGTKEIVVKQGTTAGIDGNVITFTPTNRYTKININSLSTSLGVDMSDINDGSLYLKDVIVDNALLSTKKNSTVKTLYSDKPLSIPGINLNGTKYNTVPVESTTSMTVSYPYTNSVWMYIDSITIDEYKGFVFGDIKTCDYSECYDDLTGKCLVSVYDNVNGDLNYAKRNIYSPISVIYQVVATGEDLGDDVTLKKLSLNKIAFTERVLSTAEDDYGTSYYYRGTVKDNYLNFAGMCWRIMRVQGDGSIKIILAASDMECSEAINNNATAYAFQAYYGYTEGDNDNYFADYENSTNGMKKSLVDWYSNNLSAKESLLKKENWCVTNPNYIYDALGNSVDISNKLVSTSNKNDYYYETAKRIDGIGREREPQLKCHPNSLKISEFIGTLTIDEGLYAGFYERGYTNNYLVEHGSTSFPTLSLNKFSCLPEKGDTGCLDEGNSDKFYMLSSSGVNYGTWNGVNELINVKPVVVLKNKIKYVDGDGTIDDPYVILEN